MELWDFWRRYGIRTSPEKLWTMCRMRFRLRDQCTTLRQNNNLEHVNGIVDLTNLRAKFLISSYYSRSIMDVRLYFISKLPGSRHGTLSHTVLKHVRGNIILWNAICIYNVTSTVETVVEMHLQIKLSTISKSTGLGNASWVCSETFPKMSTGPSVVIETIPHFACEDAVSVM